MKGGGGKKGQHPQVDRVKGLLERLTLLPAETLMTFTSSTQVSMTKHSAVFISALDPGLEAFVHIPGCRQFELCNMRSH